VNFLLPPREFGEGWGGVKNLQLLQGLLYRFKIEELGMTYRLWVCSLPTVGFLGRVLIEVPRYPHSKKYYSDAKVNEIILIFLSAQPELF